MIRRIVMAVTGVAVAVALAGCVVGPSLAEQMSVYVGVPESVLVAQMGVPNRKIDVDGTTYFAYLQRSFLYQPGFVPPYPGYYGAYYGPYFPPSATLQQCTVTFAIQGKMVKSFTLRGSAC